METTVPAGYIKMPDIINISITTQGQIVNVTVDTDVERTAQDTTGTILDATAPNITGLTNDTTTTNSKTWAWGADEPATFRYLIDDKPDSIPIGVYSNTTTTTISGLDGTYYIHAQAKDTAGNESEVVTVSAILATPDTTTTDSTEQTNDTTTTETTTPETTTTDTTAPNITGLTSDTTTTNSKTWAWGADEPATFRYLIDDRPESIPIGVYSNTATTTISGLNGTYYIHV